MLTLSLPLTEQVIKNGAELRIFRSGGGLRVVRVEQQNKLIGYGEHPHVEDALSHTEVDIVHGHREYSAVYGPIYPHYITGSSSASSDLDLWVLQGHKVHMTSQDGKIKAEFIGFRATALRDGTRTGLGDTIAEALEKAWVSDEVLSS